MVDYGTRSFWQPLLLGTGLGEKWAVLASCILCPLSCGVPRVTMSLVNIIIPSLRGGTSVLGKRRETQLPCFFGPESMLHVPEATCEKQMELREDLFSVPAKSSSFLSTWGL